MSSMSPSRRAWTAPKLFCACSRARTGSGCVSVTIVHMKGRRERGAPSTNLELELVDVLNGERVRRSQDHLRPLVRAVDDRVLAELAGLELLSHLARDRAVREGRDCVACQVPEVLGVPEGERRDRAVVHVLLHLARQPEPR